MMVNMMREHVPQETRIHYVITDGGRAPNVVPASAEKRRDAGAGASASVSTSVFHTPHPGHCPCHFDAVAPHSVQANTVFALAMASPSPQSPARVVPARRKVRS